MASDHRFWWSSSDVKKYSIKMAELSTNAKALEA
jgi:hypothetical protein